MRADNIKRREIDRWTSKWWSASLPSHRASSKRLAWESQSLSRQLEVSRKEECTVMKEAITGIRENGLALTPMFGCDHYE
ncbi:unnamed protein product [Musa banksii]